MRTNHIALTFLLLVFLVGIIGIASESSLTGYVPHTVNKPKPVIAKNVSWPTSVKPVETPKKGLLAFTVKDVNGKLVKDALVMVKNPVYYGSELYATTDSGGYAVFNLVSYNDGYGRYDFKVTKKGYRDAESRPQGSMFFYESPRVIPKKVNKVDVLLREAKFDSPY